MGYYIKYQEMDEYKESLKDWVNSMKEILQGLKSSFSRLATEENISGDTVNAIQNYIGRYHLRMVESMEVLLDELYYGIRMYRTDYALNIDSSEETVLCEDAFQLYIDNLKRKGNCFDYYHEQIEKIVRTLEDAAVIVPSPVNVQWINRTMLQKMGSLAEDVYEMENRHLPDMDGVEELIHSLKEFLNGYCWDSVSESSTGSDSVEAVTAEMEAVVAEIEKGTEGEKLDELTAAGLETITEWGSRIVGEFAGYISFGDGTLTEDGERGFFKLYDGPTVTSEGEVYRFDDLYETYGVEPFGSMQAFGGIAGLNRSNGYNYGGQELDTSKGTLVYNGMERYAIAIGPCLQNPDYVVGETMEAKDMAYGTCVDISIQIDGRTYYIPAIIVDVKEHTSPTGVFQTGISCATGEYKKGGEGSIVEWFVEQNDENGNNRSSGLNNFNHGSAVIIYRDEVLE